MTDLLNRQEAGMPAALSEKRVLFYVERNLHLAFLEPVHDYLAVNSHLKLCFCSPPYRRAEKGMPGFGLETAVIRRLRQKSAYVGVPDEFAPDVTVVADACFYPVKNCGKIIDVGHGLISKGFFYKDAPIVRRENLADVICVPGSWHKSILEKNVFVPIRISGFLKTDAIYHFGEFQKQAFLDKYRIRKDRKILLYAPTFNEDLSSLPCIREKMVELLEPDRVLLVKLHGMTAQEYIRMYEGLSAEHENLILINDKDFAGAMVCARVMISDVSSAYAEFMLLNKPIVLFNNPLMAAYDRYDPEDIEHQIRDALIEVNTLEELKLAVRLSLADPDEYAHKRKQYASLLSAPIDGNAVKRVAETVIDLLAGRIDTAKSPAAGFSIIYQSSRAIGESEKESIRQRIAAQNKAADFELLLVRILSEGEPDRTDGFSAVCAAVEQAKGDIVVLLNEDRVLPDNWLFWMHNYFRYYPDAAAVKCLSSSENYQEILSRFEEEIRPKSAKEIADYFFYCLMGNELRCDQIDRDCLMVKKDVFVHMPEAEKTGGLAAGLSRLRTFISRSGGSCWYAPEIFCYPAETAGPLSGEGRMPEPTVQCFKVCDDNSDRICSCEKYLETAMSFKKGKNFEAAIAELLKVKAILESGLADNDGGSVWPESVSGCLDAARKMKKDKKYTRAIAILEAAKDRFPAAVADDGSVNRHIADILKKSRDHKKNREYLKSIELLEQAKLKIA